jgi:death-on-curing protein
VRLSDVDFLDVQDVENLHSQALAASGGADGVRDRGLLESAVATPSNAYFDTVLYPSLAEMAAALAYALAQNHAFLDGNKRTAAGAAAAFLQLNGFDVRLTAPHWEDAFVNLVTGALTMGDLAAMLAQEMGGDVIVEL